MPPLRSIPGTGEAAAPAQPGGVAGDPTMGAHPLSAARLAALRGRMPPPGAAEETAAGPPPGFDAIADVAALAAGVESRDDAGGRERLAGGLAAAMLDFLAPRPPEGARMTPARIVSLLELAAGSLGEAAPDDEIAALGARAIRQELERHRDLAERRGTIIEG
jgi:hypothetical protein